MKMVITAAICFLTAATGYTADGKKISLGEVVVTATKHETFVKDVPASVTIIDSEQIRGQSLPNGDIGDILRSVPGITPRRAYAPFPASPNIRGLGNDATVILVNGIPTNWEITQAIPSANIERIEIVRGQASALYGANANGGVINIILKEGKKDISGSLGVGFGSFDTRRLNTDIQGKSEKFGYALAATYEDSNGSRVVTNQVNPSITMIDDCYYDKKAFSVNTTYDLSNRSKISLFYNYFNDQYTRGRPYVGGDWDRHFTALSWDQEITDQVALRAYAGLRYDDLLHMYDKGKTNYDPNQKRFTDYYEIPAELTITAELGKTHMLTAGFFYNNQVTEQDYRKWLTNDLLRLNKYKVRTLAGYVQDVWKPTDVLTLTAGLRYDHWENYDNYFNAFFVSNPNDRTDSNLSPKLGARYNLSDEISLWANYGVGFKPPSPTQLYDDRTSGGNPRQPNPNLKAETTQSWELGVEKWFGNTFQTNLVSFYNYTDDKILSWFNTSNVWVNKNIGGSESYGVEFSAAWYFSDHLTINTNYTYNLATIDENPAKASQEGNTLPFSPEHKANLGVQYEQKDNYNIGAFLRYLSEQYTNDDNIRQNSSGANLVMDPSFVVDLKAVKYFPVSWGFIKKIGVTLAVDNLFNKNYRTFYMYEDPGTVFSTEVSFKF